MSTTERTGRVLTVGEGGPGPHGQIIVAGRDTGPDPSGHAVAGPGVGIALTIRKCVARRRWPLDRVTARRAKPGRPARARCILLVLRAVGLDVWQRRRRIGIAHRCPVHRLPESGA